MEICAWYLLTQHYRFERDKIYLNETDYNLPPLDQLRKLLHLRPHTRHLNFSDTFLEPFLIVRDHDAHEAENLVLNYIQARHEFAKYFINATAAMELNKPPIYWPYVSPGYKVKVAYIKLSVSLRGSSTSAVITVCFR